MDTLHGSFIDRYRILERIGSGGMAVVYRGIDTHLDAPVAIKVIQQGIRLEEKFIKRFEREARTLARLSHPNIVRTIDYGVMEGTPYLVMAYLGGGTLRERMSEPLSPADAACMLVPVALALHSAHLQGVVHRDVKPSNILLTEQGEPMLSDFGVARLVDREEHTQLTSTGIGVGTPDYMAPEQWEGNAGPASDQYALGVIFFEMVTGRKPFAADTPVAVMRRHVLEPVPSARQVVTGLPKEVDTIISRTLAKTPEKRYPDMQAFADVLQRLAMKRDAGKGRRADGGQKAPQSAGKDPMQRMKTPTPVMPPAAEMETSETLSSEQQAQYLVRKALPWKWIGLGGLVLVLGLAGVFAIPKIFGEINLPTQVAGETAELVNPTLTEQASTQVAALLTQAVPAETFEPTANIVFQTSPTNTPTNPLTATAAAQRSLPNFSLDLASQIITAENLAKVQPIGKAEFRPSAFPEGTFGLAFTRTLGVPEEGRELIIAPEDTEANLWDLTEGKLADKKMSVHSGAQAVVSVPGTFAAYTSSMVVSVKDGRLRLVRQDTGDVASEIGIKDWPEGATPILRVLSDGKSVAVGAGLRGWIFQIPSLQVLWSLDYEPEWDKYLALNSGSTEYQGYYASHKPVIRDLDPSGVEWMLDGTGVQHQGTRWTAYSDTSHTAAISGDGRFLATTDRVWDFQTKKLVGDASLYVNIVFSPSGQVIASYESGKLRLTSTEKPSMFIDMPDTASPIVGFAWSPGEKFFAVQEQTGRVVFYGVPWPESTRAAIVPAGPDALKDLPAVASQALSTTNTAAIQVLHQFTSLYGDPVNALALSPDGKLLAAGTGSGVVLVWSAQDGRLIHVLKSHRDAVRSLAFSNSGALLASGGDDGGVNVWEVSSGRKVTFRVDGDTPVTFIKFLTGDRMVVFGDSTTGSLVKITPGENLWNSAIYRLKDTRDAYVSSLPAGRVEAGFADMPLHVDDVSPTGTVWYADGMSIIVDPQGATGRVQDFSEKYYYHSEIDRSRAIMSSDRQYVLTPNAVYRSTGGKERDLINGSMAAVSGTGSTIVAYQGDQGVRLADLNTADFSFDLPGSPGMVNDIVFSENGKYIAACDSAGNVWLWGTP